MERVEDSKYKGKVSRMDSKDWFSLPPGRLGRGDQWQLDESGLAGRMVDALGGFAIVGGLGPENVGDEGLRIAVVEWKPARLNLHHNAVAGQEDVIRRGKREAIEQRLVRGKCFRCFKT